MESSTSKSHSHMNGHRDHSINNKNGSSSSKNGIVNGLSVKNGGNVIKREETRNPSPSLRVNGVTVFRPIIYGNVSYRLDRPPSKNQASSSRLLQDDNQDWFRWTVYVRGIENEDLSYFIKKVVFYLHDSYTEPIRVIEAAPFELTEEGMFLIYCHLHSQINIDKEYINPLNFYYRCNLKVSHYIEALHYIFFFSIFVSVTDLTSSHNTSIYLPVTLCHFYLFYPFICSIDDLTYFLI